MLRKKIIIFVLIFSYILMISSFFSYALSASSAVVMIAGSNEVIFEKNPHIKMSMASTTKIMTALLAAESERLDEVVTITDKMIRVEGTSMGLRAGDKLTLGNIVRGMMLLSGNDAANAVAIYLCGTTEKFSVLMNKRAEEIKMKNTHFVTPSGLDDDEHYSTAYDMALLTCEAMKNPFFREIVSEYTGKVEYISPESVYFYKNHNRFLKMYEGACGVKTGFTKKSGRCLVTAVEYGGCLVVAVTLNAPDDWNDHIALYNECLGKIKKKSFDDEFNCTIDVYSGVIPLLQASVKGDVTAFTCKNEIHTELLTEKYVYAPIEKGEIVGILRLYSGEKLVGEYPVTADENIEVKELDPSQKGFLYKIKDLFRRFERWLTAA